MALLVLVQCMAPAVSSTRAVAYTDSSNSHTVHVLSTWLAHYGLTFMIGICHQCTPANCKAWLANGSVSMAESHVIPMLINAVSSSLWRLYWKV